MVSLFSKWIDSLLNSSTRLCKAGSFLDEGIPAIRENQDRACSILQRDLGDGAFDNCSDLPRVSSLSRQV